MAGRLGDILVARGCITDDQLQEALASQGAQRGRLGELLVAREWISAAQLGEADSMNSCHTKNGHRRGQTLLELVAATTILTIALVPALKMMRAAIRVGSTTETANLMTTFCASKLEEQLMNTAAVWNPSTVSGDFSAEGYANLRFQVIMSDAVVDGGIVNELMAISSTVWNDLNADGDLDAGEPNVIFASKQASNVSYQQEAAGS
ncbi:MAG: hypothetical protein CMJ50_07890 [Planctomycetaceae bacterium]|nr:hypothetical protein [Planctomycetaceae bacterium]